MDPYRLACPPELRAAVEARLAQARREDIAGRMWAGDHTVWKDNPSEISDRLGWLHIIEPMRAAAADLTRFAGEAARDGMESAVLLGMGGSSLAPEVFAATFGRRPGGLALHILDSTHPESVSRVERAVRFDRTLFIVASKSGSTIETLSHFRYFWSRHPRGKHFIAITDAGSPLESIAREHGFRRTFLNAPDIGGRYAALSYFGLVPAALGGVDLETLLATAGRLLDACRPEADLRTNPGAILGAIIGEAALAGRDKLTLSLPRSASALGAWIEQLVAESTGKEGRGILPVEREPLGLPDVYGPDRVFVALGDRPELAALDAAGMPVARRPYAGSEQIGEEFVRWEFATAFAGWVLGVNPFDQPNVQQAKDATAAVLRGAPPPGPTLSPDDVFAGLAPGGYIAITAYVDRNPESEARLQRVRVLLRDRYRVATTIGFGPRFLHSTGQFHKGGPSTGAFVQVVDEPGMDFPVPGQEYSFATLLRAQADGDLAALQALGRPVSRTSVEELETTVGDAG